MVNDYVKHSNHQSRPRLRRSAFLIFSIFIIAFALSLIFYHQKLYRIDSKNKAANPIATIPKSEPCAPTAAQTQFDFYTLLPKMQMSIPKSENEEITTKSQTHLKIVLLNPIYMKLTSGKMWNNYTVLRFFQ